MGAASEVDVLRGETLQEAYQHAADEAAYSYGSEYSGAINMSRGIREATELHLRAGPGHRSPSLLMLRWDAHQAADSLIERGIDKKWEESIAIQVADPAPGSAKTKTIVVDITKESLAEAIERARPGGYGVDSVTHDGVQRKYKRGTVSTSGSSEVQYYLAVQNSAEGKFFELSDPNNTFDSMASARINAESLMKRTREGDDPYYTGVSIRARKIKNGSQELVTLTNELVKNVNTYTVTFAKIGEAAKLWIAAGIYAC
jgi:hypothetical protein